MLEILMRQGGRKIQDFRGIFEIYFGATSERDCEALSVACSCRRRLWALASGVGLEVLRSPGVGVCVHAFWQFVYELPERGRRRQRPDRNASRP